jgi:hypothetical protein
MGYLAWSLSVGAHLVASQDDLPSGELHGPSFQKTMKYAHAVLPLVADPSVSSLLALLRQRSTILLEDCVDPVVRR